jgi:crossover junction endodeoxyribonuclease RuvC
VITFGIDPGSRKTGFGVVSVEGSTVRCIDAGVIRVDPEAPLYARLGVLHARLSEALASYAPDRVFLESIFHHKNAQSALVLGHARGVALLAAGGRACPVGEVSPAEVKKAVTGRGNADKTQVKEMVRMLLGLQRTVAEDASDALAIAIAGASRVKFDAALARGQGAIFPPKREPSRRTNK